MFSAIDAYTADVFADGDVEIRCDQTPVEVMRSLEDRLESWPVFNIGRDVLVGRVRSDRLVVSRNRATMRNAFRPVLRARIEPAEDGSRIRGRYTLMRPVIVFMTFWFGFLGLLGVTIGLGALTAGGGSKMLWFLGIVAGLAIFGTVLVRGGMSIGRSDTEEIEMRLQQHLDIEG